MGAEIIGEGAEIIALKLCLLGLNKLAAYL